MSNTQEKITAHAEDSWECVCGNEPHMDGFYPYKDGREVEPDESWDGIHYFCARCFRVIDQVTLTVVDRRDDIPLLEWDISR